MYRLGFSEWLFREERYFDFVDIDWENEDPEEIVKKVFSVPCSRTPTGDGLHDKSVQGTWGHEDFKTIACVIKGEKPVAWLKGNKCFYDPKLQNLFQHFLDMAARRGLAVIQQDTRGMCPGYIVGKPEVCAKLKPYADAHDRYQQLYMLHANADGSPPAPFPANLHREIGRILGYPARSIEDFVASHHGLDHSEDWYNKYLQDLRLQSIRL